MERIDCGLFHSPVFNRDESSGHIGHSKCIHPPNLTITDSCHSSFPLQISALIDYKNPKLRYTYNSGHNKAVITGKKDIHKYAERNRRTDMKTLYSLLRSLLPHEYIMGKRSTAEQLSETAEYIKHLKQRVEELTQKREEMRKLEKIREDRHYSVLSETFPRVKINSIGSGVLISTSTIHSQIVQSDLILTLENNGLDIISATSSAMNDKIFHTIHAKVSDMHRFESRTLYQNVWNLVDAKRPDAKPTQT